MHKSFPFFEEKKDQKYAQIIENNQGIEVNIACDYNLNFMRSLPDESIDLIVTSPPYNIGKEYEKRTSKEKYIEDQASCIAEAVRLLTPTGSICWQVGNYIDHGEGFSLRYTSLPTLQKSRLTASKSFSVDIWPWVTLQKQILGKA